MAAPCPMSPAALVLSRPNSSQGALASSFFPPKHSLILGPSPKTYVLRAIAPRLHFSPLGQPPRHSFFVRALDVSGPGSNDSTPVHPTELKNETTGQTVSSISDSLGNTSSSASSVDSGGFMEGPTKNTNRAIALTSAAIAVGLFLLTRGEFSSISLSKLAASAVPYEEALGNGKPTVLEFYADWCEVCREMAPDVYKVEQQYKDSVNFVMLNVDNSKWEEEFDEFGVEGIPHFTFLDKQGNEEGNIVGRLPKKYLEENVAALYRGDEEVPHTRLIGKFSSTSSREAPPVVTPRSHSDF